MKKLSMLLALTCSLSACASYPSGSPATGASGAPVGVMTLHEGTVQATIGLQMGGSATRRVMDTGPWTATDLSAVRVHLFRETDTGWVEVGTGAGLTFATPTYALGGPLTLTFSGLATSTRYRIVAIAFGDDGQASTNDVGQPQPDVADVTTGTRRADCHFVSHVATIATEPDERNRFDFETGTETTLDLRTGTDAAVFKLRLRDKWRPAVASGVSVEVESGSVLDQIMLLTTNLHPIGLTPNVKVAAR